MEGPAVDISRFEMRRYQPCGLPKRLIDKDHYGWQGFQFGIVPKCLKRPLLQPLH